MDEQSCIRSGGWSLLLLLALALIPVSSCRQGVSQGAAQGPPNVLFIAIDDLNDWTGFLGGHPQAHSPHLDRLAAQSTVFTCAHAAATACQPSRNSILWGLHPTTNGWYENRFRRDELDQVGDSIAKISTALPAYFRESGYHTMMAGKVFHYGPADARGMEELFWDERLEDYPLDSATRARGHYYGNDFYHPFPHGGSAVIRHYGEGTPGYSLCGGPLKRDRDIPGGEMPDESFAAWAVAKLSQEYDKPFFLALGFVRPHVPFTAPEEFFERFEGNDLHIPEVPDDEMSDVPVYGLSMTLGSLPGGDHFAVQDLGPGYRAELVRSYLASIAFVDHQVGRVLSALEESSHAGNTIVVLWSDHGQMLGEKKMWRKMNLWEEATHVPLLIKTPGQEKMQEVHAPVSLIDMYPTLLDLTGLPANPAAEGQSLVPLMEDPTVPWEKPVLSCWMYENFAVRSINWRYIRYRDGSEELYDHRQDPGEHINLAGRPGYEEVIREHRAHIPSVKADPFFRPFEGDKLDEQVAIWDSTGIPSWLR